jgi:hypothetical protein
MTKAIFIQKYWKQLLLVLMVCTVIFLIWNSGKQSAKKPGFWDWMITLSGDKGGPAPVPPPIQAPLPNSGSGIPMGWEPGGLAKRLFDEMDGVNFLYDNDLYLEFANLPTEDMVVAVYNTFNSLYGEGETLYEWMDGESSYGNGKDLAMARMKNLNLL